MIDDRWSVDYGNWTFDPGSFPDPEAMVSELHAMGFRIMLWLVPFVSPDSEIYRTLARSGRLVKGPDGRPVVREWWNGHSALLDLTHPEAVAWLRGALNTLRLAGVDGFKFDAGDVRDYKSDDMTRGGGGAMQQCEAWAQLAAGFPFNEMRACWKMGAQPLAQRLHDKPSTWGAGGLASLIPEAVAQGLIGHPFNCPDMIGGGDTAYFTGDALLDQELFVRFAKCSALFPMMQFSLAPWRVLDERHLAAVRAAVRVRQRLRPRLKKLIDEAAGTGEPILRPLAYHFPGYETVADQFLLGADLLCAPVLESGATRRPVRIPPGAWRGVDSRLVAGPADIEVEVTLESMPRWERVEA
jgi:alpha-glucosidase (family GH31 glycosyl hydrolase)